MSIKADKRYNANKKMYAVRVSVELAEQFAAIAARNQVTETELVRALIEKFVAKELLE